MKKKVTIIVPVYNSETTIERCLDNICGQTYKNLEIILVNNNSTDNSKEICMKYANTDSRIILLEESKQGPGAARNKGIEKGTGEILCFVDSDDVLSTNAIEEIVFHFEKEFDLIWFDFENYGIDRKLGTASFLHNYSKLTAREVLEQTTNNDLDSVLAVLWNKAFRYKQVKEYVIRFPENRKQGEDFAFVLRYLAYMKQPICFVRKKLYEKYEPHLTNVQENSYNMLHLARDYFIDLNNWRKKQEKRLSFCAYQNISAILADKMVLSFIRIHHPQANFRFSYKWNTIKRMVKDKIMQKLILHYQPQKGQSKWIPVFIRIKCIPLLYLLGKYKAWYIYVYIRKEGRRKS